LQLGSKVNSRWRFLLTNQRWTLTSAENPDTFPGNAERADKIFATVVHEDFFVVTFNLISQYLCILLDNFTEKKDPFNRKVFLLDSPLLTFTAKTYFKKTFSELNFGTKTSLRIRFQRLCQQIWKSVPFYIYFP
jgi:hypothetical protein